MLISTPPRNDSEKAVIKRARQLTDFAWTPVSDIPTYRRNIGNMVLPAGVPLVGFLYASEERTDKFFCENVSFESFLTAIPNPYSKLYQAGHAALNAPNYGIVCNGLVRYALGIAYRVSTKRWLSIPGMRVVKPKGEYSFDEIRLCDVLYAFNDGRNHVALITDILKDECGRVSQIEVSEAVRPLCKRESYPLEVFFEKYKLFALCRYDKLSEVPPFDTSSDDLLWNSGLEKSMQAITVDNGNKSNYLEGEETVIVATSEGEAVIEVIRNGEVTEEIPFFKKAIIPRSFSRGYYTLRIKGTDDSVEFSVNRAKLKHTVSNGMITVYADSCDENSEIWYFDFRVEGVLSSSLEKYEELTEEEKAKGVFTRNIPADGKNYKVYFKNKYGIWTHPMTPVYE